MYKPKYLEKSRKVNKVLFDWMSLTNVYNLYCAKIKTMTTIYRKLISIIPFTHY